MSVKEEKVLDYKEYDPRIAKKRLDESDVDCRVIVVQDIYGTKFNFKHSLPSTREILEFKRATTSLSDDGKTLMTDFVKGFEFITKGNKFDCIPSGVPLDILEEESIRELVAGFCKRF